MIKTNYHSHTYLCRHAQGMPEDYIKRAVALGYEEIGISCHGPVFRTFQKRMTLDEFHNIYLKNIDDSIEKYQDKIKIYKGLEVEYFRELKDHYQYLLVYLDYLILGQHVVVHNNKEVTVYSGMDKNTIYAYQDTVIEALETKYFRILAHPDIFCFSYPEWDHHCENVSRKIIEAAINNDCLLELNANGARRGVIKTKENEDTWIYPRLEFWRIISKEYPQAKVIINDDAHSLKHLCDNATYAVYEFAKKLNLNIVERLF